MSLKINDIVYLGSAKPSSGGGSLPDQAGNAGKYLKTNGTSTSWGSALENESTVTNTLCIATGKTIGNGDGCTVIGQNATGTANACNTAVGAYAIASNMSTAIGYAVTAYGSAVTSIGTSINNSNSANSVLIGKQPSAEGGTCIAIGNYAYAKNTGLAIGTTSSSSNTTTAQYYSTVVGNGAKANNYGTALGHYKEAGSYSVILGCGGTTVKSGSKSIAIVGGEISFSQTSATPAGSIILDVSTKSTATYYNGLDQNSLYIGFSDSTALFKLLTSLGLIPADRIADTTGLTAGNYKPRLTIDSQGNKTITWVAE